MSIANFEDMREKKKAIIDQFSKLAQQVDKLNELGLDIEGQVLIELKTKLDKDNFKVLVIGEFKNGKSTFINSMLGDDILPAYSTPCTAVINEVKYGEKKRATLFFKNPLPDNVSEKILDTVKQYMKKYEGKEIPPVEIDVSQLVKYVAIPNKYTNDQAESIRELPYSKVVLEYPIDFCRDGIEIIDSPGLNENGVRTKVTEEYLDQADAILFVFKCPQVGGKSEMEYVENQIKTRGHKDIFFVCNGINLVLPEEERPDFIEYYKDMLKSQTALGEDGIYFVNALGALKSKKERDSEKLKDTGMIEFESALSEYLRNNKGKTKLLQVIDPSLSYIKVLRKQHIASYISLLNQNFADLQKRISDAMPKLKNAEDKKDIVEQKIEFAMEELKKIVMDAVDVKYGSIIANIPSAIDKMELDNHMTANPFKQKEKKAALENEVIFKLDSYVYSEMSAWIKLELNKLIEEFVTKLQKDIGSDIDKFYVNLDEFRYAVSGVEKPKDISGFERVSATILGTIVGGPAYGALGASLGFGEIVKRSAITIGAAFTTGAILAFTPIGIAAITTAASVATIGAGILQIATGGKALTEKYKKQLKDSFISKMKETREDSCINYADGIATDVKEKYKDVITALDNEIAIEKSKIISLEEDKNKTDEDRSKKLEVLKDVGSVLSEIENALNSLAKEIE